MHWRLLSYYREPQFQKRLNSERRTEWSKRRWKMLQKWRQHYSHMTGQEVPRGSTKLYIMVSLCKFAIAFTRLEPVYPGKLRRLLSIESDLSNIVRKGEGRDGKVYWTCKYDLVMKFGGPELLMYASWEENVSASILSSQFYIVWYPNLGRTL